MKVPALRGFTIAITAGRRREEQAVLMSRHGAEAMMWPLLETGPEDGTVLHQLTEQLSATPPDFLLANTGYGMRIWFEAASVWGELDRLVTAFGGHTVIAARGAKALGELRKVGLDARYRAPGETLEETVAWLLAQDLAGKLVAVQLHGAPPGSALTALAAAGATLVAVPVYKVEGSGERAARALASSVIEGTVDAVTFTAAPQVHVLFGAAAEDGCGGELLNAFNECGVLAACIGEVCANGARDAGIIAPLVPEHPRLGSLASAVVAALSEKSLCLAGRHGQVRLRGELVETTAGEQRLGPRHRRMVRILATAGELAMATLIRTARCEEDDLYSLSDLLDGSLEISGARCRLLGEI